MNSEEPLGERILSQCPNAKSISIVVPYVKESALRKILGAANPSASLLCVTRWKPLDLASGASDLASRQLVLEFGGAFRLHPSLHAKYYRIDEVALVGSANLTFSALGWSAHPNLEILSLARDDFDYSSFETKVLQGSREISDEEFECWSVVTESAAAIEYPRFDKEPPLSVWRPSTRHPSHLFLSYAGREDEIASEDEQAAARRDLEVLQIPPGLTIDATRAWTTTCLLASPFACSVIAKSRESDLVNSYQSFAAAYGLGLTEARRAMETVENWLAFLAPETLQEGSGRL